jgi:hypothetical protein
MPLEHKVHVHCLSCYYHHKTIPRYPLTKTNNKITTTISNMPTTWSVICHHSEVGDKYHIYLGSISEIGN